MAAERIHVIELIFVAGNVPFLENACKIFLDGRLSRKDSCWCHVNCVLSEARCDGGGVTPVAGLVKFAIDPVKQPACFWISNLLLLGDGRGRKADCQPCQGAE